MSKDPKRRFFGKPVEILPEDRVKLKAFLGIKPGYYLAVLYAAAILAVLFVLFLYPGIAKPGSRGVFSSEPSGAAVRVDGITLGYTPCEIFIPNGKHRIEFVLPGFTADVQELESAGRIFVSRFFPRRISVNGNLSAPDPAGAFALSALEFIHWSYLNEATEAFQIPQSLSEGAYRTGPAGKDPAVYKALDGILGASLRYGRNKSSLRDLLRARFLVDNAGQSPSPLTLIRSVQDISARIGGSPEAAAWLGAFPPGETERNLAAQTGTPAFRSPSLSLAGMDFVPAASSEPPFLIASAPASQSAWDAFTAENPLWRPENRAELVSRGLAGDDYLVRPDTPAYPDPAAPGISWYAAQAYCAWLSGKLPPAFSGWEVRLPSEAEWESALGAENREPGNRGQNSLAAGLLWEWCSGDYAPFPFFPLSEEALAALEKAAGDPSGFGVLEKALRGGSWINPAGSVDGSSRGSLPPETSSPFVGFRPVLAPKAGQNR